MHLPSTNQGPPRLWNLRLTRISTCICVANKRARLLAGINQHFIMPFCISRGCDLRYSLLQSNSSELSFPWSCKGKGLMEQGADICSGKLAGAAGSSQPRWKANPQHSGVSLPDIPFLLADTSQVWEGRAGQHEIQMSRAEPKGNLCFTKTRSPASSPHELCCSLGGVGLCEENLESSSRPVFWRSWSRTNWNQRKGWPWFQGSPWSRAVKWIIFWMCPKDQWEIALGNYSSELFSGSLQFQVFWEAPTGLTCGFEPPRSSNWIHPFPLILTVNELSAMTNKIPLHP